MAFQARFNGRLSTLGITTMTDFLTPRTEYDVKARRISGTHAEKLERLDTAIQALVAIKLLEGPSDRHHGDGHAEEGAGTDVALGST
jgi:hypothetical protein